jgi:hypothetical protein
MVLVYSVPGCSMDSRGSVVHGISWWAAPCAHLTATRIGLGMPALELLCTFSHCHLVPYLFSSTLHSPGLGLSRGAVQHSWGQQRIRFEMQSATAHVGLEKLADETSADVVRHTLRHVVQI